MKKPARTCTRAFHIFLVWSDLRKFKLLQIDKIFREDNAAVFQLLKNSEAELREEGAHAAADARAHFKHTYMG